MSVRDTRWARALLLLCLLLLFVRPALAGGPRSPGQTVGFLLLFAAAIVIDALLLRYFALPSKERALAYRVGPSAATSRLGRPAIAATVILTLGIAVVAYFQGEPALPWLGVFMSLGYAALFAWVARGSSSSAHDLCSKLQEEADKTKHERTDGHRRALVIQNREQYLAARDDAHGRMQRFVQNAALHEFLKCFPDRYSFVEILACESEPWTLYLLAAEAQKTDVLATEQKQVASEIQDLFSQIERDATTIAAFTTGFEQLKVKLSLEIQDPNARAQAISLLESNKRALFRKKGWF